MYDIADTLSIDVRSPAKRKRFRGFSLIETAMSLAITASALVGFMQLQNDTTERIRAAAAANKLQQVATAAQAYLTTYNAQLMSALSGGTSMAVIPTTGANISSGVLSGYSSLQGGGYLPSTFIDKNPYAQGSSVVVKYVPLSGSTPAHIEALVTTTGGNAIKDSSLGVIMGKLGGIGGAMLAKPPAPAVAGTSVIGSYGGWSTTAAAWTSGTTAPAIGHAQATMVLASSASGLSNYLDRYSVTGMTEPNTMHASINMSSQTLGNVGGIGGGTSGALSIGNYNQTTGALTSTSDISVTGAATVAGAATVGTNLQVNGTATVNGTSTVGSNLQVDGTATVNGATVLGAGGYDAVCGAQCGATVNGGIELRSDWLRVIGSGGVYWQSYGGGLYMADTTWIRTFNNASIYSGTGAIRSDGTGGMQASIFQDLTASGSGTGYYLKPSGTSNLNYVDVRGNIQAPIYYDINNTSYYALPSGQSVLNSIWSPNYVQSPTYYDSTNTGYYVQPANSARMNYIAANNIYTYGYVDAAGPVYGNGLETVAWAYPGWGCNQGAIANNSYSGGLLFCVSGTYQAEATYNIQSYVVGAGTTNFAWAHYCAFGGGTAPTQIIPVSSSGELLLWQTETFGMSRLNCW